MLGSEPVVEPLGHLLHVERLGHPRRGINEGDFLLLFSVKRSLSSRSAKASALCPLL